jgi:asparagine synthase (glutamine-hydrolysing)
VELAWRLPPAWRFRRGRGKLALRAILEKRVPPKLWHGPKSGFSPPVNDWLRGPLRDWAEDLLSEKALRESDLTGAPEIRARWTAHLAGRDEGFRLWAPLMAQLWLRSSR